MNPERYKRVDQVFQQALSQPPESRESFLREACDGDENLRREIQSLLEHERQAGSLIDSPLPQSAASDLAEPAHPDLAGRTFLHYRIAEKIGEGGMGAVFLAEDTNLNRQVAIKVLPDTFLRDRERLARFDREARLLASLNHPNIAAIYGLERTESSPLLIMELVKGETLAERLAKGPLPVGEALEVCRQIAEGLEAAHEKGIVHRDLKPANVKITTEGQVKILDFGLAKAFQGEAAAVAAGQSPEISQVLTHTGMILGTAAYMSPEQANGKAVDKRADIWAFGCILFECLTGNRAFEGRTTTETLVAILKEEPNWEILPAATPSAVKRLLRRCLEKDPRKRLHDIADARIEIEEAAGAPHVQEVAPTRKPVRAWMLLGVIGALVLAVAAVAFILWPLRPASPLPVVRSRMSIGPGLWLDGLRTAYWLERPSLTAMAVASDGSFIVYSAISENPGPEAKPQIYLRRMDQMDAAPVAGTEGGIGPFLSPDDRWLGFWEGGKLRKVRVTGGLPATLCDCAWPFGADWGSDNTIVFCPGSNLGLSIVSGEGGKPDVLTRPDPAKEENGHRLPRFLPGGRDVLFTVMRDGQDLQPRLALLDLGTRRWRVLMEDAADARYLRTGHLVFLRQGTLMAVVFDLDRLEVKGQATPVVAHVMQAVNVGNSFYNVAAGQYSVTDAGWLAYVPGGILPDREFLLVWVDQKGNVQPAADFKSRFGSPRLSPDGQRIAYLLRREGVWIYDLSRAAATRLTGEGGEWVTWSPDGKRLVFSRLKSTPANLYWQPADGSSPMERLTTSQNWQMAGSFTPDGSILAFVESNPQTGFDILLLDMKSRQERPFLNSEAREVYPEFSPDGRWLAYGSDESGRIEIWVRPFPGPGGRWQISKEGGREPLWSKDGKQLFYRWYDQVWVVDIRTGGSFSYSKPHLLFEQPGFPPAEPIRNWDIWPDGRRFLMAKGGERKPQPVTEMILVQNWFEELKRLVPTK